MTCEHTKKQRIRWLGARPSDIYDAECARLVRTHPHLLRDRVEISGGMMVCGATQPDVECGVNLCVAIAEFECDGCDIAICAAHATNRGTQEIVTETGFNSPGFSRMATEDTFDLCPFCLFNPGLSVKPGRQRRRPKKRTSETGSEGR